MPGPIKSNQSATGLGRTTSLSQGNRIALPESFGSSDYRFTTLEPNHIVVEDEPMDDERWSRLAFALSMPCKEQRRSCPEARRFAQQMRRRSSSITSRQTADMLSPLLSSILRPNANLRCRRSTSFHRESIPDDVPDFEVEDGWKTRLPTPKPTFTIGYAARAFSSHQLELQQGIIANNRNEPCDLHKVSQPLPEVYWPFFVVEVQDESMLAARNACAGSAATCNNGLMIFAGAAEQPYRVHHDMRFLWTLSRAVQSFSLAINGKTACLNTHNSEGCLPHAVSVIKTYQLDSEEDVEALASRLGSIMVWAENCRLGSILDLLDKFDDRVRLAKIPSTASGRSYDPTELANFRVAQRRRKSSIIKDVFVDSLPRWARTST